MTRAPWSVLALLAGSSSLLIACGAALAQPASTASGPNYPLRAIRIIVPLAPGGGTDNLTRIMAPKMTGLLGQQIVVENRAGAGGQIGTELVARAAPDGYTLLNTDTSFSSSPSLFSRLPYDPVKDFAPVSLLASSPVALVVHPSVPARTLKELLALAKIRPRDFNFAMGGLGTGTHMGVAQFKAVTGIDIVAIPYKGGGPASADVLAGQVTMMFAGPSSITQHVATGRLRALAVTGDQRLPAMPDVPTFRESGMSGVDSGSYWVALAPAATPRDIIALLSATMVKVLQMPEVRQRLIELGYQPLGSTPEELSANLRSEMAKWARTVKETGVRVE
ncbi:MAG TPA: tripartite tricarboxylate transporter substrate binding protein [Burkholderiales bacterium]|nr:tripartite tricarboxylate transporter substrate binding protein [Burkholderiales bacterium]